MSMYYETLEVSRDATIEELVAAKRAAAREHHPDRHASASEGVRAAHARKFREAMEAFDVLSDPGRRAAYDLELARSVAAPLGPPTLDRVQEFVRKAKARNLADIPSLMAEFGELAQQFERESRHFAEQVAKQPKAGIWQIFKWGA